MAPRKQSTVVEVDAHKTSQKNSKVIKRPARGYHKFRSGVLNVSPKGAETELVRNNQQVPLLQLPPEIRARIWEYTLGHKMFMSKCFRRRPIYRVTPSAAEPSNGTALLRTCRQIYSETALIPSRFGTFACEDLASLRSSVKVLKTYQRKQIKQVRVDCEYVICVGGIGGSWIRNNNVELAKTFPALKQIEIVLHKVSDLGDEQYQKTAALVRVMLNEVAKECSCALLVRGVKGGVESYVSTKEIQ